MNHQLLVSLNLLKKAATDPAHSFQEVHVLLNQVLQLVYRESMEERTATLKELTGIVKETSLFKGAMVAVGCGALVESGCDPTIALETILSRLTEALQQAIQFVKACHEKAEEAGLSEGESAVQKYGPPMAAQMPDNAGAFNSLHYYPLPVIAMLSRSRTARQTIDKTELLHLCAEAELREFFGNVEFLWKMLQVLDEEVILVLHPDQKKGYRLQISGIADNFQLHTLLADVLTGNPDEGWLEGVRPDARVVAVMRDKMPDEQTPVAEGTFNLVTWQGINAPGDSKTWIWGEGVPADIPYFETDGEKIGEKVRVILLTKAPYNRTWNSHRLFSGLIPEIEVLEKLSPEKVDMWLKRIKKQV